MSRRDLKEEKKYVGLQSGNNSSAAEETQRHGSRTQQNAFYESVLDRRGRDGGGVNKLGLKIILCIAFLSFNLLTGAESPVSEKQERINNVEYNETLKYKTTFLRKPPLCPLSRICEANSSVFCPLNPEGNIQYTYDSFSGSENSVGRLVRIEDSNQNKTFSYDKLGRVKKETRVILATTEGNPLPTETAGPYITETRYDLLGRVTR
ncbi:hypothetical protein LEP1GSC008_0019, partial [Leptospira kirschneri serovar Bulgarica str. Nikolaevo]